MIEKSDSATIKSAIWRIRHSSAPGADDITAGMLSKAWLALQVPITQLFGMGSRIGFSPTAGKQLYQSDS